MSCLCSVQISHAGMGEMRPSKQTAEAATEHKLEVSSLKPKLEFTGLMTLTIPHCVRVQVEDLDLLLKLAVWGAPGGILPADYHDLPLARLLGDEVAGGKMAGKMQVWPRRPCVGCQVQEVGVLVIFRA